MRTFSGSLEPGAPPPGRKPCWHERKPLLRASRAGPCQPQTFSTIEGGRASNARGSFHRLPGRRLSLLPVLAPQRPCQRRGSVAGTRGGLHTYTPQMVWFSRRWSRSWWNGLNIKTPPSAICSPVKRVGQMLTSFEMIDSSLTRDDAARAPAVRRSPNAGPHTALGAGHVSRQHVQNEWRESPSTATADFHPTSPDFRPGFHRKNVLCTSAFQEEPRPPSTAVTTRISSPFCAEDVQTLPAYLTAGERIIFSNQTIGFY